VSNSGDILDPKGLMHDAFDMDEITPAQCRSIFLDWALSLPSDQDTGAALRILADRYCATMPAHPMAQVLTQGLSEMTAPKRRGGWRSRARD